MPPVKGKTEEKVNVPTPEELKERDEKIATLESDLKERDDKLAALEEQSKTASADVETKLEEVKRELALPADDRELLDRMKALDHDKLTRLLNLVEGKQEPKTETETEMDETAKRFVLLETQLAAEQDHRKKLEQRLFEAEQGAKAEKEREARTEHIRKAVAGMPNATGLTEWLTGRCSTIDEVDVELKDMKVQLKLDLSADLGGLTEGGDGTPKGKELANAGSFARPMAEEKLGGILYEGGALEDLVKAAGGGRRRLPVSVKKEAN